MSGWRPSKGRYGPFGTARTVSTGKVSEARKAQDFGFSSTARYNEWMDNRQPLDDETRGGLNMFLENIDEQGKFKNLETEKFGATSDYDAAVMDFQSAQTDANIASAEYGSFDVDNYSDLTDQQKGSAFTQAEEQLESAELDRISGISDIEGNRGDITGKAISASQKAAQARMDTGLEYSGGLESNIRRGELASESAMASTQLDEIQVQDRFRTAESNFNDEMTRIENEWTQAKQSYDNAFSAMYGETGAQAKYDEALKSIETQGRLNIIEDISLGQGVEDIRENYIDEWTFRGAKKLGGRKAGEEQFTTGSAGFQRGIGEGFGGFGNKYDTINERYELAKQVYGSDE
tara:strand:+ start:569 stop:1612 length:1044 start_codon:yes stop_codon:yes gene_type:complete